MTARYVAAREVGASNAELERLLDKMEAEDRAEREAAPDAGLAAVLDELEATDRAERKAAEQEAGPPPASSPPPERRRGPLNTYDWRAIDGEIARRCIDPEGRLAVPENENQLALEMQECCEHAFGVGVMPGETAMRGAVKQICAAMRKGPEAAPQKRTNRRRPR